MVKIGKGLQEGLHPPQIIFLLFSVALARKGGSNPIRVCRPTFGKVSERELSGERFVVSVSAALVQYMRCHSRNVRFLLLSPFLDEFQNLAVRDRFVTIRESKKLPVEIPIAHSADPARGGRNACPTPGWSPAPPLTRVS